MGRYFQPPTHEDLIAKGARVIYGNSFAELNAELQTGEILIALFNRSPLPFWNAVHLYSQAEYSEFVVKQNLTAENFYALPESSM